MEPLRGVTAKKLRTLGYPDMTYAKRQADLDSILDMIMVGISRKFGWEPA